MLELPEPEDELRLVMHPNAIGLGAASPSIIAQSQESEGQQNQSLIGQGHHDELSNVTVAPNLKQPKWRPTKEFNKQSTRSKSSLNNSLFAALRTPKGIAPLSTPQQQHERDSTPSHKSTGITASKIYENISHQNIQLLQMMSDMQNPTSGAWLDPGLPPASPTVHQSKHYEMWVNPSHGPSREGRRYVISTPVPQQANHQYDTVSPGHGLSKTPRTLDTQRSRSPAKHFHLECLKLRKQQEQHVFQQQQQQQIKQQHSSSLSFTHTSKQSNFETGLPSSYYPKGSTAKANPDLAGQGPQEAMNAHTQEAPKIASGALLHKTSGITMHGMLERHIGRGDGAGDMNSNAWKMGGSRPSRRQTQVWLSPTPQPTETKAAVTDDASSEAAFQAANQARRLGYCLLDELLGTGLEPLGFRELAGPITAWQDQLPRTPMDQDKADPLLHTDALPSRFSAAEALREFLLQKFSRSRRMRVLRKAVQGWKWWLSRNQETKMKKLHTASMKYEEPYLQKEQQQEKGQHAQQHHHQQQKNGPWISAPSEALYSNPLYDDVARLTGSPGPSYRIPNYNYNQSHISAHLQVDNIGNHRHGDPKLTLSAKLPGGPQAAVLNPTGPLAEITTFKGQSLGPAAAQSKNKNRIFDEMRAMLQDMEGLVLNQEHTHLPIARGKGALDASAKRMESSSGHKTGVQTWSSSTAHRSDPGDMNLYLQSRLHSTTQSEGPLAEVAQGNSVLEGRGGSRHLLPSSQSLSSSQSTPPLSMVSVTSSVLSGEARPRGSAGSDRRLSSGSATAAVAQALLLDPGQWADESEAHSGLGQVQGIAQVPKHSQQGQKPAVVMADHHANASATSTSRSLFGHLVLDSISHEAGHQVASQGVMSQGGGRLPLSPDPNSPAAGLVHRSDNPLVHLPGPGQRRWDSAPGDKRRDSSPGDQRRDPAPGDQRRDSDPGDQFQDDPDPIVDLQYGKGDQLLMYQEPEVWRSDHRGVEEVSSRTANNSMRQGSRSPTSQVVSSLLWPQAKEEGGLSLWQQKNEQDNETAFAISAAKAKSEQQHSVQPQALTVLWKGGKGDPLEIQRPILIQQQELLDALHAKVAALEVQVAASRQQKGSAEQHLPVGRNQLMTVLSKGGSKPVVSASRPFWKNPGGNGAAQKIANQIGYLHQKVPVPSKSSNHAQRHPQQQQYAESALGQDAAELQIQSELKELELKLQRKQKADQLGP